MDEDQLRFQSLQEFQRHVQSQSAMTKDQLFEPLLALYCGSAPKYDGAIAVVNAVSWWNAENPDRTFESLPLVLICGTCKRNRIDFSVAPFYNAANAAAFCGICKVHICTRGDADCGVDYCIDCNPNISQLRAFKPCEFRCQRHILTYTEYDLGPLAYQRGFICRKCHSLYLADGEQLMLDKMLAAIHRLERPLERLFTGNPDPKSTFRELAYIGMDKLRYLVTHRDLITCLRDNLLTMLGNRIERDGVLKQSSIHYIGDMALSDVLLDSPPTPKIRPWTHLRVISRIVIIFRRYKEDFYDPNSGKYIKDGQLEFRKRVHEVGTEDKSPKHSRMQ